MSLQDMIKAQIRTAVGSSGLGETLTYQTQKTSNGDKGRAYSASATLTGFFLNESSDMAFIDDGEKDQRTARVRTADTETELEIGDRFVAFGWYWRIVSKTQPPGQFVYQLESTTRYTAGAVER